MEINDELRRQVSAIEDVLVPHGIRYRTQLLPPHKDKNAHFDAEYGIGKKLDRVLRKCLRKLDEDKWAQVFQAIRYAPNPGD